MGSYDLKRLEVAIQYIRRMAEGRNPVTNKPAPENAVLTNVNVNRCLKFVEEILSDVHSAGGQVGAPPRKSSVPKSSLAETFPYEILAEFQYEQDQQISYLLKQIGRPLPEDQKMPVAATLITTWLRENGYLEKRMMEDIGKENSVPTEKGRALGLYSEKAGMGQNMYYRVYYNENAQRFIVDNFQRILREYEEIRARVKKSRKQAAADSKPSGRQRNNEDAPVTRKPSGRQRNNEDAPVTRKPSGSRRSVEDDPALASLLSNISDGDVYGPEKDGFSKFDCMGEGWEDSDEGIPW